MILPVKDVKGKGVGLLDICNCVNGTFDADQEYLASVIAQFCGNCIFNINEASSAYIESRFAKIHSSFTTRKLILFLHFISFLFQDEGDAPRVVH
mmetsp:Transcript_37935/g.42995  ORF Transcript_37935/g.42995 Transcript_37935/m.42995 type:complete len:95 (+) Transcript_37935:1517-1801(+)